MAPMSSPEGIDERNTQLSELLLRLLQLRQSTSASL